MSTIWIVTVEYDHEGSNIIGVFSKAQYAAEYADSNPMDIEEDEWAMYMIQRRVVDLHVKQ